MPFNFFEKALVITAGAIVLPIAIPAAVAVLGFGTAGISAGTVASTIMTSYGGEVAKGSACAILQSIGAAGSLSAGAATAAAVVGGVATKEIINSLEGPPPKRSSPPPEGPSPTLGGSSPRDGMNGNYGDDEDDEYDGEDGYAGGNGGNVTERPQNATDDAHVREISDLYTQ
ncbi:hypothetical protein BG015_004844 [Linnemannia schmuckeri]|uniref:Uncharacterized protein n=1 Tax=Linnemannia schmuckeri TaxID=64567 RepID=A0A9P5S1D9_9FUNG|nr:hypothetical protein BG015_004844 [Linnemannia schmuckeri]